VSFEEDPDVQLMLALQNGDDAAFRVLFDKHARGVTSYAMQWLGNRSRAEDITQEVFLQVYRHRSDYVPKARFVTWLYRMVSNACITDARRAEYRQIAYSLDQPGSDGRESPDPTAESSSCDGETLVAQQQHLHLVKSALDALPPPQRAALWLARVDGMSYEEVARSLGCSLSAVKSLIHRATQTLRRRLSREG
jgi:RNA polymerase sigma-70 factor (ECF subfamily)